MKKRILHILLAAVLMFSLMPLTVFSAVDITDIKAASYEYGNVKNLDFSIIGGNIKVEKATGSKTTVEVSGHSEFVSLIEVEYSTLTQTLKLRYDKTKANKVTWSAWEESGIENKITVKLAYTELENFHSSFDRAGEVKLTVPFKNLKSTITGAGIIWAPGLSFTDVDVSVNGSGHIKFYDAATCTIAIKGTGSIIDFHNATTCKVTIDGSGYVSFNDATTCKASITDWGYIDANKITTLDASISNRGQMKVVECGTLKVKLDVKANEVSHFTANKVTKSISAEVKGVGTVSVLSGEVETLYAYINSTSSVSEINAEGVTADKAEVEVKDYGTVKIGRVKTDFTEKCSKNADLTVYIKD